MNLAKRSPSMAAFTVWLVNLNYTHSVSGPSGAGGFRIWDPDSIGVPVRRMSLLRDAFELTRTRKPKGSDQGSSFCGFGCGWCSYRKDLARYRDVKQLTSSTDVSTTPPVPLDTCQQLGSSVRLVELCGWEESLRYPTARGAITPRSGRFATGMVPRSHVDEVLLHFAITDAEALVRAQIQREDELIRERRAAEEAERKRREEEERQRRDGLNDEVARWRQAQDIREYCRALAMNRSGAEVTAHVEWALEYADSIDPLTP